MKSLGVQLYSVRDLLAGDRREALRRLAEIGYRAVEHYDPLNDPVGFRGLVDEFGLTVCSTHGAVLGPQRDDVLAAAATIGTDTVIVPSVDAGEFADRAGLARTADRLNEAAAYAARVGVRIGYHNHAFELSSIVDGRAALEILAELLAPEVLLEVDVYWAATGGADVPALLGRLGDRVRYLHIKDGPAVPGVPMTAVGAGTLPIPAILAAAPAMEWPIVELDECATDMVQALADSHAYLEGLA